MDNVWQAPEEARIPAVRAAPAPRVVFRIERERFLTAWLVHARRRVRSRGGRT